MKVIMNTEKLSSISDLERFIDGSHKVAFAVLGNKSAKYAWIQSTLIKYQYLTLKRNEKSTVIKYIQKMTNYSQSQVTRLIQQYKKDGCILYKPSPSNGFDINYTRDDILALVKLDELHGTLNGNATKKLCERAWNIYQDSAYKRLANISVAHLYNLRASAGYKNHRLILNKPKPVKSNICKRKTPIPNGKPGYLRIDTVHQGDYDKRKGVYHINAVDEVTQFEVICTIEKISEQYLKPVLEYILDAFPFVILGLHADNGSEYINYTVAKLLNKLFIEFTKSRARKSNDNALVESKNGSIIRKYFGYQHIPQRYAPMINIFNKSHLNYYLNYHRPCLFSSGFTDSRGKEVKKYMYEDIFTPYEKLKSLPEADTYLKEGVTLDELDYKANMMSDSEAAKQMNAALKKLFQSIFNKDEQDKLAEQSS